MDEDIKAEIRRSLPQSSSAFNCGYVETTLGPYAPDAIVLPPNSPAVQGTLVKISAPSGRGFSRHEDLSSDACFWMLSARGSTQSVRQRRREGPRKHLRDGLSPLGSAPGT